MIMVIENYFTSLIVFSFNIDLKIEVRSRDFSNFRGGGGAAFHRIPHMSNVYISIID